MELYSASTSLLLSRCRTLHGLALTLAFSSVGSIRLSVCLSDSGRFTF